MLGSHPEWNFTGWVKPMVSHLVTDAVLFIIEMENEYRKTLLENPEIINADVSCLGMSFKTLNLAYSI